MKIWANCIVNNEENFIWFAIMSVVDYVDKILVWDTGSTDKTVEIIREIIKVKGDKIEFREVGVVDKHEFTKMRQRQLDLSDCDWILVLDGDEIWWDDSIKKLVSKIKTDGNNIEGVVVPMKVPVGDIYHLQDESAGRYNIKERIGYLSIRAFSKKIPGLEVKMPYGSEGYYDNNNTPIQKRVDCAFLNAPYFHLTHLKRSSKKDDKFKYELGKKVEKNFKFPESLYLNYPKIVPSPWATLSGIGKVKAYLLTPLRQIKRRFLK